MNLEEVLNKAIEKAVKEAILRAHPVGSYFISDEGTNPDVVLFGSYGGGTSWERVRGRFLYGETDTMPVGTLAGESNVTLTIENMPRHTHRVYKDDYYSANSNGVTNTTNAWKQALVNASNTTCNIATEYVGGGQSHNNMPPFRSVFIWRRTA